MRINRETLMRLANETIEERVNQDRSLISVYLCGSLLGEDYLLGGTADVDLVFIHVNGTHDEREILFMMDDVHLDIAHHSQNLYRTPRALRVHAWLGPTIKDCEILHDPQHFMDFTQASVRGQYNRPDRIYERARSQVVQARKIWLTYQAEKPDPGPTEILEYLKALGNAVNAVASFSGAPLTERRFLIEFPTRAEELGKPGMPAGLLGLLGAANLEAGSIADLIPLWRTAYEAVPPDRRPARIHPIRQAYYEKAFEAMLEDEQAQAVLWPLIRTWAMAVNAMPSDAPERLAWRDAFEQLGLLGESFQERIVGLDAFLDLIEETNEGWARRNGVWVE
jgi:hypothetical protein